ncbi:hypothetical protein [Luteolibacter sp. LG18]|uniref:hypothetical protein n=1 Tax=Luteolibacter sp. LG18 TaxID=2819286 RepID=UPI002B2E594F|nr:hypothetical protein llg_02330 [Luteolibacter sp. LG18]
MSETRDPGSSVPAPSAGERWFGRSVWGLGLLMVAAAGFVAYEAMLDQSTDRIAREHGIALPASASNPECRGDAWHMILDRGASSTFEMARKDLCGFVSKLKVQGSRTSIPGNEVYRVSAAWTKSHPMASYECESPTGDFLDVQIFPIDCKRVGVRLYTDWN